MEIEEFNITELKALAYDHLQNIEKSRQTLNVIHQEIKKREVEARSKVLKQTEE